MYRFWVENFNAAHKTFIHASQFEFETPDHK